MVKIEVERLLERGLLWARMGNGNLWRVRRNGETKTWKTRPDEYRIPIKAGLKSYGAITDDSRITAEPDESGRYIIEAL